MSDKRFQPNSGQSGNEVKVTSLVRAKELSENGTTWQVPDLQAVIVKESRQAFERMLASARQDVAEALSRLRDAELKQARDAGFAQGQTQGYEAGYAQGYAEAKAVVDADAAAQALAWDAEKTQWYTETQQRVEQLLLGLTQSLSDVEDVLVQDMLWLTTQMAQRLVMDALTLDPNRINQLVAQVVARLPQLIYPLHIRLNAEDLPLVDPVMLSREGRVELHEDAQLARGECVVRSGHSEVSLSWQAQTRKVMDAAVQTLLTQSIDVHSASAPLTQP